MTIKYIKGNLLDTDCKVIVHGCNCQGVMGSGVAKAIRWKFPEAYNIYRNVRMYVLGAIHVANCDNKIVINALTQEYYGRTSDKQYVDYTAVRACMRRINTFMENIQATKQIAIPKIGCGLGGGDWDTISGIIDEELPDFEILVYEL